MSTATEQKRVLMYIRVSTDKQAEKGIALPTQKDRCLEALKGTEFIFDEDTDLYVDSGESARTMDRPAILDMLNRCKIDKDIGAVIVYDISRLARERLDFAFVKRIFKEHSIKFISATEPIDESPEGQILEGILSSVAEFSSTQSARRIRLNMQRKAKDGHWPTRAPYGYQNKQEKLSSGKDRRWIEVNWEEAKWIIQAFELFATGNYSIKSLVKKLQADDFPVRKHKRSSGKFHASTLEKILRDKFYIGVIEWGGVVNPDGKQELFLDRKLFEKVQAILDARLGGASRNRRLFSLLKGISWCGECGSRCTVEEHTTTSGNTIRYMRCLKSKKSERVTCSQPYAHEDVILEEFGRTLKQVKLPKSFVIKLRNRIRSLFSDEQAIYEKARADILSKIEDTKRRKKNLVLQLIDKNQTNEGDFDIYEEVKIDLALEEKRLNEHLEKIENQIASVVRTIEIALALAVDCHYAYKKAEPEMRALLARTFFKKIIIQDKQITQVVLNEPLGYLCRKRLIKYPIFDLTALGGHSRNQIRSGRKLPKGKARDRTEAELRAMTEDLLHWVTQNPDGLKGADSAKTARH